MSETLLSSPPDEYQRRRDIVSRLEQHRIPVDAWRHMSTHLALAHMEARPDIDHIGYLYPNRVSEARYNELPTDWQMAIIAFTNVRYANGDEAREAFLTLVEIAAEDTLHKLAQDGQFGLLAPPQELIDTVRDPENIDRLRAHFDIA